MRLVLALLVVAGLGCDSLFGLQHIDPLPDGPRGDLPATYATGRQTQQVVTNDAQRQPAVSVVPQRVEWIVVLDDDTLPPVSVRDDGTFDFARDHEGQAYRLIAPDHAFEIQHTASHLELGSTTYGRSDRDAVPGGTLLAYSIPNAVPVPTRAAYVNTTGLWTSTKAPNVNGFTIDWSMATSLSGPLGLLRVDKNDRAFYVLDEVQGNYTATVGYHADDVTLPPAGSASVTANFTAASRDACIHVLANHASVALRLEQAGMTGPKTASWTVRAVPIAANGPFVGFATASAAQTGTLSNVDLDVAAANPYPGHDLVLAQSVLAGHTFLAPGATTPVTLDEGTEHSVMPDTVCEAQAVLDGAGPLPSNLLVDGAPLATDGQAITVPRPGSIELAFTTASPADRYRVDVYELSATAGGATEARVVVQIVSAKPAVRIDSALLEVGRSYTLRAVAEVGYPNASVGDMTTISYPFGAASQLTKMFTIAN